MKTGFSVQTVNTVLRALGDAAILREMTGGQRGRLFVLSVYLDILNRD